MSRLVVTARVVELHCTSAAVSMRGVNDSVAREVGSVAVNDSSAKSIQFTTPGSIDRCGESRRARATGGRASMVRLLVSIGRSRSRRSVRGFDGGDLHAGHPFSPARGSIARPVRRMDMFYIIRVILYT
jgi:hypothetical protein